LNCKTDLESISLSKTLFTSKTFILSPCFLKTSRSTFLSLSDEQEKINKEEKN